MRSLLAAITLACVLALSFTTDALAKGRHHHHHRTHHHASHHIHYSDGRPSAWCGFWMSQHIYGRNIRNLWLARNWANQGRAIAGPIHGAIGVMAHHVFQVVSVVGAGRVLAISGNDGHAVRTRVRSTRGVIAWRQV